MLKPTAGRALSAAGAILLLISLVVVWYHVERPTGTESSTGWDAFPRLRWIVAGGALLTLVTALVRQTRPVLIARTVLGVVVGALILRRIIDPPEISAPVTTQLGMATGLVGALMVALGGLVDTGRKIAPVIGLTRPQLPAGGDSTQSRTFERSPSGAPGGATADTRGH
jgi:hypothetical protein